MDSVRRNVYFLEALFFAAWGIFFGLVIGIETGTNLSFAITAGLGWCLVWWVLAVALRAIWKSSDAFFKFCMCCAIPVLVCLLFADLQMKLLITRVYTGANTVPYSFFASDSR
jgi:RsiW-degrading membrane proteinase PrsW (M82 family)